MTQPTTPSEQGELDALKARNAALEAELKQLREQIPTSTRERLLIEAERIAHLGSWMWDLDTQQVSWSDEMFRILGKDPKTDTATVAAFYAAVHPDDMPRLKATQERNFASKQPEQIEIRFVRPSGEIREIIMDGALILNASGNVKQVVGCCLDVTENRASEREIKRSRALLETMEQLSGVGAFYYDYQEQSSHWSSEMYKIFGTDHPLSTEEFHAVILPDDLLAVIAAQQSVAQSGFSGPITFRIRRPDGQIRHVIMSARLNPASNSVNGSIVDITERIVLETQLRQAQKMEAIGRLAGGIAHDFNNLLTAILGNTDLLLALDPSNDLASEVRHAATHAAKLTRQLLTFSRHALSERHTLSLNDVISGSLSLLRRVIGEGFDLRFLPAASLWPVLADPNHLNQVLLNLVINARDAMPGGGPITISTHNVPCPDALNDCVMFKVSDLGSGMDDSTRSKLFDPFFTTKTPDQGTGLGLSTVYGIVTQHGGRIEVDSALGQGSTFRIYLPRTAESTLQASPPPEPTTLPAHTAHTAHTTKTETILVLEDEPRVQRLILQFLKSAGYQVIAASRCDEAARLITPSVSLLLSDIILPDGNGTVLACSLRLQYPALKVLHITGHVSPSSPTDDTPVLEKPFSRYQLLSKIREILDA